MTSDQERLRVAVSSASRTVMRGWWSDQEAARDKFRNWIGSHGNLAQPRLTLTNDTEGTLLTSWPEEPQPEPGEQAIDESAAADESIPPMTSD